MNHEEGIRELSCGSLFLLQMAALSVEHTFFFAFMIFHTSHAATMKRSIDVVMEIASCYASSCKTGPFKILSNWVLKIERPTNESVFILIYIK
jgi:hypothetical protein